MVGIASAILGPTLQQLAASLSIPLANAGILRAAASWHICGDPERWLTAGSVRYRQKRYSWDRLPSQALIEPSQTVAALASRTGFHFNGGQHTPVWLQQVRPDHCPQRRFPVQRRLIPPLQRPVTAARFRPAG